MANAVTQTQAVTYGRQLQALAKSFVDLRSTCKNLQVQNNSNNYDVVWASMATSTFYGDGSVGPLDSNPGNGMVAVTQANTSVTFSVPQSGLVGATLMVTGDTSNGLYRIVSGSGTNWNLFTMYNGPTNPSGSWSILNPIIQNPIVTPANPPIYNLPSKQNLKNMENIIDAFLQFLDGTVQPVQLNRNNTLDSING